MTTTTTMRAVTTTSETRAAPLTTTTTIIINNIRCRREVQMESRCQFNCLKFLLFFLLPFFPVLCSFRPFYPSPPTRLSVSTIFCRVCYLFIIFARYSFNLCSFSFMKAKHFYLIIWRQLSSCDIPPSPFQAAID